MSASDILRAAGLDVPEAVDAYLAHAFTRLGVATDICLADEALEALAREVVRWKWVTEHRLFWTAEGDDPWEVTPFTDLWERDKLLARYEQEAKP